MALALAREDAVQGWRDLLGPKELEVAKSECPDRVVTKAFRVTTTPLVKRMQLQSSVHSGGCTI